MKIVIGSTSNRKIKIVDKIFKQIFKCEFSIISNQAKSNVPETPYDKQTFDGSRNRALDSKKNIPDADFYVGLESGLIERYGHIYEEAWTTIINKTGDEFYGYSSGLKVPDYIINKMNSLKLEHCNVMTIIEKEFGNLPNDTWGTYSGGLILREISLEESLRNAIIQTIPSKKSFYIKN